MIHNPATLNNVLSVLGLIVAIFILFLTFLGVVIAAIALGVNLAR